MKDRPPLLLGFEVYEILGIEEASRVRTVVGPSHLAGSHGHFGKRRQNDAGLIRDAYALGGSSARSQSSANPNCALVQVGQELRPDHTAEHEERRQDKRGRTYAYRDLPMFNSP